CLAEPVLNPYAIVCFLFDQYFIHVCDDGWLCPEFSRNGYGFVLLTEQRPEGDQQHHKEDAPESDDNLPVRKVLDDAQNDIENDRKKCCRNCSDDDQGRIIPVDAEQDQVTEAAGSDQCGECCGSDDQHHGCANPRHDD